MKMVNDGKKSMSEDICPCCVAKEIIENCVRAFLKENEISHLDAIIALVQTHNNLLSIMHKRMGKNALVKVLRDFNPHQQDALSLTMHLSININDFVQRIREE